MVKIKIKDNILGVFKMKNYLEKMFILEGIILGIIGILFFINPLSALYNFTSICGILLTVYGIVRIIRGFQSNSKLYYIITGIVDILFGLIIWYNPITTTGTLILIYGIYALIKGVYSLIISIKYKKFELNALTILSILSIILGLIILLCPIMILFVLPYIPYVIGTYFIVIAVIEIYLGFKID